MKPATKRPKIAPEFKQEAVALVTQHGYSVAKAAQARTIYVAGSRTKNKKVSVFV